MQHPAVGLPQRFLPPQCPAVALPQLRLTTRQPPLEPSVTAGEPFSSWEHLQALIHHRNPCRLEPSSPWPVGLVEFRYPRRSTEQMHGSLAYSSPSLASDGALFRVAVDLRGGGEWWHIASCRNHSQTSRANFCILTRGRTLPVLSSSCSWGLRWFKFLPRFREYFYYWWSF